MAYNSFINKQVGIQSPTFRFQKDRNNGAVLAGDGLGEFQFYGFDGSGYLLTSAITSTASGTIAANRIGSNLEFYTHPDSVTASTQRMVISNVGEVIINNPDTTIPALQVTNNGTGPNINLRTANATAINSPHIHFTRSRVGTADVNASDDLGRLEFRGFQGGTAIEAADIRAQAETVNGASVSGSLQFRTRPTTYAAINTRMNISADGNVTINGPVSGDALTIAGSNLNFSSVGQRIKGDMDTPTPYINRLCIQSNGANMDTSPLIIPSGANTIASIVVSNRSDPTNSGFGQLQIDNASVKLISGFLGTGTVLPMSIRIGMVDEAIGISTNRNVTISTPVSGTALTIVGGGETITAGDLTLSAGNINLTTTTSGATGVITAGGNRFIHNYGATNTFVGVVSGNFTLTGTNNTGLGTSTLSNVTSGTHNTALAPTALTVLTTGSFNTAVGQAYQSLVSGSNNIGIGYGAGLFITTGSYNIILGNYNDNGGQNYTLADSSNICIGNAGVTGQSNAIRIGISGSGSFQQNKCFIAGIDGVDVGSVAKVVTMASDQLGTATITAGAGISVTPGANTITIASTNGIAWTEVTGTSQAMAVDSGYIANNAGLVTLTLPATAAVGDRVRIAGKGAGGWKCAQNAGQTINFGNTATTVGTGGSIDSTNQYDALELLCITANTTWVTLSSVGNLNVV